MNNLQLNYDFIIENGLDNISFTPDKGIGLCANTTCAQCQFGKGRSEIDTKICNVNKRIWAEQEAELCHPYLDKYPDGTVGYSVRDFLNNRKDSLKDYYLTGVHSSDTWDLCISFCVWLYEHLNVLVDKGGKIIDFEFHIITIDSTEKNLKEWIDEILTTLDDLFSLPEEEENKFMNTDTIETVINIFKHIVKYLWW